MIKYVARRGHGIQRVECFDETDTEIVFETKYGFMAVDIEGSNHRYCDSYSLARNYLIFSALAEWQEALNIPMMELRCGVDGKERT